MAPVARRLVRVPPARLRHRRGLNQAEHGNSALWQLRLNRVWDLPRQTSITYGVGYGRHSYDGDPENRTLFYLTLNIPF